MNDASERLAGRPPSVGRMLLDQVATSGPREAFRYPNGDRWVSLSWDQTKDLTYGYAAGLLSLGLRREDRVAIASSTRIEWILADLAVMCAGGATTTVYPTTQHEDVAYILSDSGAVVVVAEDDHQVAKVLQHEADLPALRTVVQLDGRTDHPKVMSWADLLQRGRAHLREHPGCVDDAVAELGPEDLATLIYTSGTTGRPKGVRLAQDSWTYEGAAIEELHILGRDDLQYLWLPLSHVFGKALIAIQLKIGFATAVDGNIDRIVDNLRVVNPTFMAGAPRIFEKVRARVLTSTSGVKGQIARWAFAVGKRTNPVRLAGRRPTGLLAVQYALAHRLVFRTIQQRMGGRIKFFVSGSAALSPKVQEWFYAAGLLIIEGYGLTESSAATFVNLPGATRFGTVGPPVPGSSLRIDDDGEIWVKGPGVMRGYHNLDEATREVLRDGWLATGDLGELDEAGYLRVTDRKKDLIKTSGGKYVAPQKVEGAVKAACPYLSQAFVYGEGRKYISALLTVDPDAIQTWAQENGRDPGAYEALVTSPEVRELIGGYVERANAQLARWETVKRFEILPGELSIDEGEVTPSLKIRRQAVEKRYQHLLSRMYDPD